MVETQFTIFKDWPGTKQDATAPDPFILDDDFRLETLLNHVAVGRFFSFDLEDGQQITTVGGKKLTGLSVLICVYVGVVG